MANLFGLDIAKLVSQSISAAGGLRSGNLTKYSNTTRTGGNLTAGLNPSSTTHTFDGFVESREVRRPNQIGATSVTVISILGDSITTATVPKVNDKVSIDGTSYTLIELLELDPAGAVYEFLAEA